MTKRTIKPTVSLTVRNILALFSQVMVSALIGAALAGVELPWHVTAGVVQLAAMTTCFAFDRPIPR